MNVLCVNCGSSSLKIAVYEMRQGSEREAFRATVDPGIPISGIANQIAAAGLQIDAIAHRIVAPVEDEHPAIASKGRVEKLTALCALEPIHLPAQMRLVEAASAIVPYARTVLCFDSSFHRSMPKRNQRYALARELGEIRRYGYHGLSYEYLASTIDWNRYPRVVAAHLGGGSSACAMRDGASVDTTMGYSPISGMMMSTRCGDLDPAAVLTLLARGFDAPQLLRMLSERSGLVALAKTGDMRNLVRAGQGDERAKEAIDAFVWSASKAIASMIVSAAGVDLLLFTGGIGTYGTSIVNAITGSLQRSGVIGSAEVTRIGTNEALMMARHAMRLIGDMSVAAMLS